MLKKLNDHTIDELYRYFKSGKIKETEITCLNCKFKENCDNRASYNNLCTDIISVYNS